MVREIIIGVVLVTSAMSVSAKDYSEIFVLPKQSYPVVTPSLVSAVGNIDIKLDYPVFRSVAVVGADELCGHWLTLNNDYLVRINAIGIVVNVESAEQLSILQMYTDIPLVAVSGFGAEEFGHVYPYVIDATAGRVRQ